MDDKAEWKTLQQAFAVIGIDEDESRSIYKLMACILHFGNITFTGMFTVHVLALRHLTLKGCVFVRDLLEFITPAGLHASQLVDSPGMIAKSTKHRNVRLLPCLHPSPWYLS
jgi:hypothetical protein